MLLLGLVPPVVLCVSLRKWRLAEGTRRYVWGTFAAGSLAWVLLLLAWALLPLWLGRGQ